MKVKFTLLTLVLLLYTTPVLAQSDWTPLSKERPETIGEIVAFGHFNHFEPDILYNVGVDGKVQLVSKDNDPKCGESGVLFKIIYKSGGLFESFAPKAPGDCKNPQDGLYTSITKDVKVGDTIWVDTNDDSGQLQLYFDTKSPTGLDPIAPPSQVQRTYIVKVGK
jgi:hypothetical protein